MKLTGKRYLKMLSRATHCNLRVPTWMVYSHLVARGDRGDTHRGVAWATGLSEGHTIKRQRDLLIDTYGLPRRDRQRLYALPPEGLEHWWHIEPPVEDWGRAQEWP